MTDDQDARPVVIEAVMNLFGRWGIPEEDRLSLLHISNIAELDELPLERLGVFLSINKYLYALVGKKFYYEWMTSPNRAFDGKTPAQHCIEHVDGARYVEAYLIGYA
jgi:hypothetical protein